MERAAKAAHGAAGARVLSVNVGSVRSVPWRGELIATGIFKFPVDHRVAVRDENVAGDEQADRRAHGGPDMALYAYAREDYDWWASELETELEPGRFGENLMTAGIAVNDALIGERWGVGTTVLEVAQPRVPCFKLGLRMNDNTFPRRFARALRPGAYLRIVEEGELGAQDAIHVLSRPTTHVVTVRDVAEIFLFDHLRAALLVAVPELGESWRDWAREHLQPSDAS